jgi:hypothetical protein
VAAADNARPMADACTSPGRCSSTPSPRNFNHKAIKASGSAASCDSAKADSIRRGSCWYPSLHSRHIDDNAGGSASSLREDIIGFALFVFSGVEPLRLQIEHRPVAPALGDQFVVRPELDDAAVLEHADPVGVADRGKAMRNQDGGAIARGRENPVEDFRFTAHVELRRRFVEND